eukprot:4630235-Pyramimonas_sp.AAC.2
MHSRERRANRLYWNGRSPPATAKGALPAVASACPSHLLVRALFGWLGELGEVRVVTADTGVQNADVQPRKLAHMPAS